MTDPLDVQELSTITLRREDGIEISLIALGARITGLMAADREGVLADVVLGHDRPEDYLTVGGYLGATCGRYANRIAHGRFSLDGRESDLDRNEGAHQLHGGRDGFDRKIWGVASLSPTHVTFATHSPDGEMGFPGAVDASCTYQLVGDNSVLIEMIATASAPTMVNLANHVYFNLAGQGAEPVLGQSLKLHASHYTPVDATKIPTGEIRAVQGTGFDFTTQRPMTGAMPGPDGLDHNFCLSAPLQSIAGEYLRPAAELVDPASGRALKLWTSEVGLQVYTGAHFDGSQPGKAGARYGRFAGIALETQKFPDAPNHPQFPSARLDPGQLYRHLVLLDLTPDKT
ncbi:GalM Galactose mutarotase and related enzymes [Paracoccaceae bacterium]